MHLHLRFVCSQAIKVDPEPPNGSNTSSPGFDEFLIPCAHNAIGFIVGCSPFLNGLLNRHIELVRVSTGNLGAPLQMYS